MRTIAFVGPSGTGKSHRAMMVARKYGADAIIDDGLLISETKVIAGVSAKRSETKIASVKCALFMDGTHAEDVSRAIYENNLNCVMVLGTSDGMVNKIAKVLKLPPIEKIIRIEDVATEEEMEKAKQMRTVEGKHVIPVPTFEIRKDFSGYFLHPLKIFQRNLDSNDEVYTDDKSIVRPTFSYLGDYTISDNVICEIATYVGSQVDGVDRIVSVNLRNGGHGAHIDVVAWLKYGVNIIEVSRNVQKAIRQSVEAYTSINARRVHIYVKKLTV